MLDYPATIWQRELVEHKKNVCHQEWLRKRGGKGSLIKTLLGVVLLTLRVNASDLQLRSLILMQICRQLRV